MEGQPDIDKNTNETIISWLLFQDIAIIILAIILNSIAQAYNQTFFILDILEAISKSILFILFAIILGKSLIPRIFEYISRFKSFELLFVVPGQILRLQIF